MSASDVQRLFLQALMSRQCMPVTLARALCKTAVKAVNSVNESLGLRYSDKYFEDLIGDVQKVLEPLSLEFRQMMSEDDGQPICAIINLKGDEVAQMATQYSAMEIAYFKLVVEQIMLAPSESFCLPSMLALKEVSNMPSKSLTKSQAELLLQSFVANGWLNLSGKGRYTLASRAVMELDPYLRSTYEDEVLVCTTCMEIVTKGISCNTPNCKCRLHNHCYQIFMKKNRVCPACQADWSGSNTRAIKKVGEEAAGRDADQERGAARKKARRSRGGDGAENSGDDDEEPEAEMEPESEEEGGSRGGRGAPAGEDEDEDEEEEVDRNTKKTNGKGKQRAAASPPAASSSKGKGKGRRVVSDEEEEEGEENEEGEEQRTQQDARAGRRAGRR